MVPGTGASFAELLKYLRQRSRLTQRQVAERAGVSERGVSDLERGTIRRPYGETAKLLADALELAGDQRTQFLQAAQRGHLKPTLDLGTSTSLTPLIGREQELEHIRKRLAESQTRLLTLCGVGGVGKTRLALEITSRDSWRFRDGARFVDLSSVSEPELVLGVIAQHVVAGTPPESSPSTRLISSLKERQMLLVLDNLEHVLAAAPEIARLLEQCPHVMVLATSRVPLRLRAEHQIQVLPLPLPAVRPGEAMPTLEILGQNEAVRLFIDRATAHGDFELQAENARDVVEICRRLDGLPLAIELAAARTSLLPPAAIVPRLTRSLSLLVGGPQDLPPRHQALRSTIDWSYRLLSEEEQRVFRAMAVFAGGTTLPLVAQACCPAPDEFLILEHVGALVNWGLLLRYEAPDAHQPRLTMLETIREYARDCLVEAGELDTMQRAHALTFLALVENLEPDLLGSEQTRHFAVLDAEQDNIRAALAWAVAAAEREDQMDSRQVDTPAADIALRLASAMWWYWETRGHFAEGQQWLERALALRDSSETLLMAQAQWRAGALAYRRRELDKADAWLRQALAVLQANGHVEGTAWCQAFLGLVALVKDQPAQARACHEAALASARLSGLPLVEAGSLSNLGEVAHAEGNLSRAVHFYTASLEVALKLPDKLIAARTMTNLAIIEAERGNLQEAFAGHQEALRSYQSIGDSRGIASSLEGMAVALARWGVAGEAVWLFGAAATLRQRMGAPMSVVERAAYETGLRAASTLLRAEVYADAWGAGSSRDTTEVVRASLALRWPDLDLAEAH